MAEIIPLSTVPFFVRCFPPSTGDIQTFRAEGRPRDLLEFTTDLFPGRRGTTDPLHIIGLGALYSQVSAF